MLFESIYGMKKNTFFSAMAFAISLSCGLPSVMAQTGAGSAKPATPNDINTYMTISVVTFCEARGQGVSFDKSIPVALAGQASAVFQKHGGVVPGSSEPLSEEQFFKTSPFMLIGGAMKVCKDQVPADQQKKFEKAAAELKSRSKK